MLSINRLIIFQFERLYSRLVFKQRHPNPSCSRMEIDLKNVSFDADMYQVKEEFARILHSDYFRRTNDQTEEQRLMNFKVELEPSERGWRHTGFGKLFLPNRGAGQRLLQLAKEDEDFPSIESRRIMMRDSGNKPTKKIIEMLRKVPYQEPSIDRERDEILSKLALSWRIDKLQIGLWLKRPTTRQGNASGGVFAVEWEKDYTAVGNARLAFDYENKFLIFHLGDPSLDDISHRVIIKFFNIRQMWAGYDFRPCAFSVITFLGQYLMIVG